MALKTIVPNEVLSQPRQWPCGLSNGASGPGAWSVLFQLQPEPVPAPQLILFLNLYPHLTHHNLEILLGGVHLVLNSLTLHIYWFHSICPAVFLLSADLQDIVGLVPDHSNKANTALKQVTGIFQFPSAYESSVYTILY